MPGCSRDRFRWKTSSSARCLWRGSYPGFLYFYFVVQLICSIMIRRQDGRPNLNLLLDVSYEVGVEVLTRLGSRSEDGEESFQLPAGVKVTRCETLPTLVQDRSEFSYGSSGGWGAGT